MKKQLLLPILFCLLFLPFSSLKAQNWAPVGATWYFTQTFFSSSDISYTKVEVEKDTIVLGKNCSKLIGNFDGCMWKSQFMYESNDSVYFYHPTNNKFEMLFDFGATAGDIWKIPNYSENFGVGGADTTELFVDSVGMIIVSGESLRVIYTKQINSSSSNYEFGGAIIEKIGASYMFPSYFACDPVPGDIRCYSDGVIDYKTINFVCDAQHVGLEDENLAAINISPNPFNDYFDISTNQEIKDITLTNLNGQHISFEQKGNRIYLKNIPKGIYLLSLELNGRRIQQKLIKEL